MTHSLVRGLPAVDIRSREPGAGSREPGAGSREPGAGSRDCVRRPGGPSRSHRPPHLPRRAADAMRRAVCARWERPSRLSLRPRRPAGPASSPSCRHFLSRTTTPLAQAGLPLAGGGPIAAPAPDSTDVPVSNIATASTSTTHSATHETSAAGLQPPQGRRCGHGDPTRLARARTASGVRGHRR